MKVFLKILLLFIISQVFGALFVIVVANGEGDLLSVLKNVNPLQIIDNIGLSNYVFFSQVLTILLPAIIFLFLFHKNDFLMNSGFYLPKQKSFFTYALFFLFLSYPLIQLSADLNQKMFFVDWFGSERDMIARITMDLLRMNGLKDLFLNIFLIAILPALGEELFFRAGIQNELVRAMKNKDLAIIITAIIFSAFHLEFDGFIPRFFLGLLLGYVYYWSSSIWVPVLVHFINNSLLVVSAYFSSGNLEEVLSTANTEKIPMYILLMSIVAVFVLRNKMYGMFLEEKYKDSGIPFEENEKYV